MLNFVKCSHFLVFLLVQVLPAVNLQNVLNIAVQCRRTIVYCKLVLLSINVKICVVLIGDEAANSDDLNCDMDSSRILRVRTLHISSPILAAKSPFFYKVPLPLFFAVLAIVFTIGG